MKIYHREEMSDGNIMYREKDREEAMGSWISKKSLLSRVKEIVLEPLKETITQYLNQKDLEKLSQLSCEGKLQKDLTDILREQKLITPKESVYIAGTKDLKIPGVRKKLTGIQIRIEDSKNYNDANSWFIWNIEGYGRKSSNNGAITLMNNTLFFKDDKIIRYC